MIINAIKKIIGAKSLNLNNSDIFAYFSGKWPKKNHKAFLSD